MIKESFFFPTESCNLIGQDLFGDVTCAFVYKMTDTFLF